MSVIKAKVTALRDRSRLHCKNFASDQNGSLTAFTLVLFLLMVMMGGLAVDLMRYEQTRTTLQNTLDRATLASASLTQTLDPDLGGQRLLHQGRDVDNISKASPCPKA